MNGLVINLQEARGFRFVAAGRLQDLRDHLLLEAAGVAPDNLP
jgi:hypothetical protein